MSKQLSIAIGLVLLSLAVILLVSAPGEFFARGISLIDTELRGSSGNERFVKTNMDFSKSDQMGSILLGHTEWTGFQYDMSNVESQLGADILVTWGCRHPSSPATIWFLILQSRDVVSFHPPPVCYAALGYEIEEESTLDVEVSGEGWAQQKWVEWMDDPDIYTGVISVKKLVVTMKENEIPIEKRLVLYYFVKDSRSSSPREITMIRVSAIVPLDGSYDHILSMEKKLIADFFPLMFEPRSEQKTVGSWLIHKGGVLGYLTVAVMILIPIGFLAYPIFKTKNISTRVSFFKNK